MDNNTIALPQKFKTLKTTDTEGSFEIDGLFPGYGHTIGNSLRRILLSSIPGLAVTWVKIEGVDHEFQKLEGMREDVLSLVLNLKKLRFASELEEADISVSISGPKVVTGEDFNVHGNIKVINTDLVVCELTKKMKLNIELHVQKGIGYAPREMLHKTRNEIGLITLDGLFSPVKLVRYEVDDTRVGDRTDYNKLTIHIQTDGTISPQEAFEKALEIMIAQLVAVRDLKNYEEEIPRVANPQESEEKSSIDDGYQLADTLKTRIDSLDISSRTLNALKNANIRIVGGLTQKTEEDLLEIPGLGQKGIQEIKDALKTLNLGLKS